MELQNEIRQLNAIVTEAIFERKGGLLEKICTPGMIEHSPPINSLVMGLSNLIDKGEVVVVDQFLQTNEKINIPSGIKVEKPRPFSYTIPYQVTAKETYVSLLKVPSKNMSTLLMLFYVNTSSGYRLQMLHVTTNYAAKTKTAPELFQAAKQDVLDSLWVGAWMNISTAKSFDQTNNPYMSYSITDSIALLHGAIKEKIDKEFENPFVYDMISTEPELFEFFVGNSGYGLCPQLKYVTKVDFNDEEAMREERVGMALISSIVLPGLLRDADCVIFEAYKYHPVEGIPQMPKVSIQPL